MKHAEGTACPRATDSVGRRWAANAPIVSLCLALAAVTAALLPGVTVWLQYDRAAVAAGETWRIFSGHVTHFGSQHLLLDVAALLILGVACERRWPGLTRLTLGASGVVISLGLFVLRPDLHLYRGLSGLDAALFALLATGLLGEARQARSYWRCAALASLGLAGIGKIVYEVISRQALFLESSAALFEPIPLAHALGALVGIAAGLCTGLARAAPS